MSFLSRFVGRPARRAPARLPVLDAKASRAGPLIAWPQAGRPVWTPRDYAALAREGFQANAIVHRCVRMIAEAAASVPMLLFEGEREVTEHPLLSLLARPNPRDGRATFLEAVYGHLLLAGNAYLEQVAIDGIPREIYALRPDRMKIVPGTDGWPEAWDYSVAGKSLRFQRLPDGPGVVQPILHLTLFHPLDDHYGLSPIEAAAAAIDIHNAAAAWNKALLDNAARPSGALVYAGANGAVLSDEQVDRLKADLEASFQGAANAGRPLLLEGGLDWKPLSLSPKDMDFTESKAAAAREIALAFGVPPMMLGLPGDNTFANFAEANRSFWRQTVLPLASRSAESLVHWLAPMAERRARGALGPAAWPTPAVAPLRLVPDLDRIDALSTEREALWRRIGAADFLGRDEKRVAVGYGAEGGGVGEPAGQAAGGKFSPDQPRVPAGSPDGGNGRAGTGEGATADPYPPAHRSRSPEGK
jgi:HK97 family phage portal protein